MNYIQTYYGLPLAIVFNESKVEYIQALLDSREQDDISIFNIFMTLEYTRLLTDAIQKFKAMNTSKKT